MLILLLFGQLALAQHFNFDHLFGPNPQYSGQKLAIQSQFVEDYEYWRLNGGVQIPNLTHQQFRFYLKHHTQPHDDYQNWILNRAKSEEHQRSLHKILSGFFEQAFRDNIELTNTKDLVDRFLARWI